jgi:hypothetical protein
MIPVMAAKAIPAKAILVKAILAHKNGQRLACRD